MVAIKRRWARRDFLSAAGIYGSAVALSAILPELGDAKAAGTGPKRLLLVNTGNGTVMNQWRPRTPDGQDLPSGVSLPSLQSAILEPLDHLRDKLVLVDGLDMGASYLDDLSEAQISDNPSFGTVSGHASAMVLWTGRRGFGQPWSQPNGDGEFPDGPSVDQVIAQQIGTTTAFGSIQLATKKPSYRDSKIHSYDLNGTPLPPEYSAAAAFDQIFAGAESNEAELERRKERGRRSLAVLRGDLARLRSVLPGEDRLRLEAHLEHVDALEQRLDAAAVCTIGEGPGQSLSLPEQVAAMNAIIHQAFACDRTRVVSYTLVPEVNNFANGALSFLAGWDDTTFGDDHGLSHLTYYTQEAADVMTAYCRWQATQFAALLDLLQGTEEAPGETMLDNTVVVWGMAMSHGGTHLSRATPAIIATGKNGRIQTDRYLRFGDYDPDDLGRDATGHNYGSDFVCTANNHLLVSLCHAFGLEGVTTFGDPRFTGPLAGLEVL
ncbi:MAG: DUF1552 domain-containing protein [Myxococcales bacterium]|nr:DUF1552 domain-containing protein [Myxococcales bacterium]